VTTISDVIDKYIQKPEIPLPDKLELKAIERRLNTLVLPLNHCLISCQKLVFSLHFTNNRIVLQN